MNLLMTAHVNSAKARESPTRPVGLRPRARLSTYLLALCMALVIPILVFAGLIGFQFVSAERARLEGQAQEIARAARTAIDQDLIGLRAVVETLATNEGLVRGDYDTFDARAREVVERIGINIVVRDLDGQQVVNTRVPRGTPLPLVSQPEWDDEVVSSRRAIITGVFTGALSGTEVVIVVAPVIRDDSVVALINLSLPTERVLGIVQAERPDRNTSIFVTDQNNRIVAHTDDHAGMTGQFWQSEAVLDAAGVRGTYEGRDRFGETVFVAYQRSPLTGWIIATQMPRRVLEEPLRQSLGVLVALGLALALISGVATFAIATVLRGAVQRVAEAAQRMGNGEVVDPPSTPVVEADLVGQAISGASHALREQTRSLYESEARLRRVLDNLFSFVGVLDRDGTLIEANEAPIQAAGVPREELVGKLFWDCYWWSHSPEAQSRLKDAVVRAAQGETVRYEAEIRVAGGGRMIIDFQAAPLLDETGAIVSLVVSAVDITARKRGEEQNARLAAIVSSTTDAVISFDIGNQTILTWNRGAQELFGYAADEAIGRSATFLLPPERRLPIEDERGLFNLIMSEGQVHAETVRRRKDGSLVDVSATGTRIVDAEGNVIGVSAIFRDITARKEAEERQKLLIRELHHRIKNTLATVQAIAGATIRSSRSMPEFRDTFAARLSALAQTHSLLTENAWASARLRDLLEAQFSSFVDREDRIVLEGPDLLLPSEMLVALGMVVHELATNAVKYGALSTPAGRVAVAWRVENTDAGELLRLSWRETGGPEVSQPSRTGFGSLLLERVVGPQLKGRVDVAYLPTGVEVTLDAAIPPDDQIGEIGGKAGGKAVGKVGGKAA